VHSQYRRLTFLVWQTCLLTVGLAAQDMPSSTSAPPITTHACSLPGLTTGVDSFGDAQLLTAYNAQADRVRSLQVYAMVRAEVGNKFGLSAKKQSGKLAATIQFQAPAMLRVTGVIPFSDREIDMASNGREFRLLVPVERDMRFLVGSVDASADSPNPKENLRPRPLIDALRWPKGTQANAMEAQPADNTGRRISIQLPTPRGLPRTAQVEFDLRSGTVSSLSIYGPDERLLWVIRYSDWEEVANQATGAVAGCYPRRIVLVQSQQDFQLDMRILNLDLNPQIPTAHFLLNPPKGVPVVKLSSSGAKGAP
jgi:hypothetical protein